MDKLFNVTHQEMNSTTIFMIQMEELSLKMKKQVIMSMENM